MSNHRDRSDDAAGVTVPPPVRGYLVEEWRVATARIARLTLAQRRRLRRWAARLPRDRHWPIVQLRDRSRVGARARAEELAYDYLDVASARFHALGQPGSPYSWAEWAVKEAGRVLGTPIMYALLCRHHYPDVPGSWGHVIVPAEQAWFVDPDSELGRAARPARIESKQRPGQYQQRSQVATVDVPPKQRPGQYRQTVGAADRLPPPKLADLGVSKQRNDPWTLDRAALEWLDTLPPGTALERGALATIAAVLSAAWAARAAGGPAAGRRAWEAGLVAAFDVLAAEVGTDAARAAFGWAIDRLAASIAAVSTIVHTEPPSPA